MTAGKLNPDSGADGGFASDSHGSKAPATSSFVELAATIMNALLKDANNEKQVDYAGLAADIMKSLTKPETPKVIQEPIPPCQTRLPPRTEMPFLPQTSTINGQPSETFVFTPRDCVSYSNGSNAPGEKTGLRDHPIRCYSPIRRESPSPLCPLPGPGRRQEGRYMWPCPEPIVTPLPYPRREPEVRYNPPPRRPTMPAPIPVPPKPKADDDLIQSVLDSIFDNKPTEQTNGSVVVNLLLDVLNQKNGKAPEQDKPILVDVPPPCSSDQELCQPKNVAPPLSDDTKAAIAESNPGIECVKEAMYFLKLGAAVEDKDMLTYVICETKFVPTRQQVRQILYTLIKHGNMDLLRLWQAWFGLTSADVCANRNKAMRRAIAVNNIDICAWLAASTCFTNEQARADDNVMLRAAAYSGLEMCRWVCDTFGLFGEDIKARNCEAIVRAGERGDNNLVSFLASRMAMRTAPGVKRH